MFEEQIPKFLHLGRTSRERSGWEKAFYLPFKVGGSKGFSLGLAYVLSLPCHA